MTQRVGIQWPAVIGLYQEQLLRHVRRQTKSLADAEDIVQETWLRAAAGTNTSAIVNVRAFLYRIAGNLVIDSKRHLNVRNRVHDDTIDSETVERIASHDESAEQALIDRDRKIAMEAVISKLPERAKQALLLSRVEGWSHARISKHLGVSSNTIASDIRMALEQCLRLSAEHDV